MNNAELINRLRDVPCWAIGTEAEETMLAAADLIEAQAKRIEELEAQLPKESEWMKNIRWYYQQPTQIVATTDGTHFMCRSTGKLCKNATEYGYCKQTVCTTDSARR